VVAGVALFLFGEDGIGQPEAASLLRFQKTLKYGLPDDLSVSCYEYGFADRVVAQRLCDVARSSGFSDAFFPAAIEDHRGPIATALTAYPSYFESVLAGRS
jgi:hypothetical protein